MEADLQSDEFGFDPDALRAKYRHERDRRIRPDGEGQYIELEGEFARYVEEDPNVAPGYARDPIALDAEVVILGGGFAGLVCAVRLAQAGFSDIHIIEGAGDFGGTWYWNRYPGAQCDIESYIYLPLLEETGFVPKEKYSYQPEIHEHLRRIGKQFGLYDNAIFQTRVREVRWDDASKRWSVTTDHGDDIQAQFLVGAMGMANRPRLPGIPGIGSFEGKTFHTSRWDYDYTGGDTHGGLDKLGDKKVAVIGTGATAIQCVPHLGAAAEHLYVFQRTPSSVDERGNKPTDPEWVASLKPGWQLERINNFCDVVAGRPFETDLVADGWTSIFRKMQNFFISGKVTPEDLAKAEQMAEIADFEKMNEVRDRVDRLVENPETAELLKPWYRQFCKRPTFNDEYLPTFNRPNVTLVDTSGSHGVERITKRGVVANGVEYEVDCIIFGTGFEISSSYKRRFGIGIYGRDGQSIYDHWAKGRRTLHGHSSHGFPNLLLLGPTQGGVSPNYCIMMEEQTRNAAYILSQVKERGAQTFEPTAEAESDWVAEIHRLANDQGAFLEDCTPGYYNNEATYADATATLLGDAYGAGPVAFNELVEAWRAGGDCKGLRFEK